MKPNDICTGVELCRNAGWNQLRREWELFLQLSPDECRVAIKDEEVVGTVTTIQYQNRFSWVGMVLVDPAERKKGIGKKLLSEAIDILSGQETIKLDATPAGRELYLKLDFIDEYRLSRMIRPVVIEKLSESSARTMCQDDLAGIAKTDVEIFGADRLTLLAWLKDGAPQFAFVCEDDRQLSGYCLGRSGNYFDHIGPIIADDTSTAIRLASAALRNCNDRPVIIDTLHHSDEWLRWLDFIGFREQRPFTRMFRGKNNFPGIPSKQFAIAGPEFG